MQKTFDNTDNAGRGPNYPALACCLHGQLLQPSDDGYEAGRTIHNAAYTRHPRAIVRAAGVADVVTTVNFARENGLTLAVRSGGHSVPGHSSSDDIVLDLSAMKSIDVDPGWRTVRVGPGATWGEVSEVTGVQGLAVPAGDTASVGVGGLTVGGGIGWLVRKHGLTIDSLLSVDMVLADGSYVTANAQQNPDLFWAVRGGGGNFGIVTAFEFQAHRVGTIVGGAVFYDAAEGENVLRRYVQYASEAPDELSTIVFIMNAPPLPMIPAHMYGKLVIVIGACYAGDIETGQQVVEPLRRLGTAIADATGPMPYSALYKLTEGAAVPGHHSEVRSAFFQEIDDQTIDVILEHTRAMSSPFGLGQLRVLGGAMARVPNDATAFAHRDKPYMFSAINVWMDPTESETHRAWTRDFWADLQPRSDGVYVNFLSDEGEGRILDAYGAETYERLAALKETYDPTNFFSLNQNIKPAQQQEEQPAA